MFFIPSSTVGEVILPEYPSSLFVSFYSHQTLFLDLVTSSKLYMWARFGIKILIGSLISFTHYALLTINAFKFEGGVQCLSNNALSGTLALMTVL